LRKQGKESLKRSTSPLFFQPRTHALARRSETHHVVAAVDVEDVAADAGGQRAAKEGRRVRYLLRQDAARQRRALGGVIDHVLDVTDALGSARGVRARRDQVDAHALVADV